MACSIRLCEHPTTRDEALMCRAHWAMVPKALRSEVWATWRARKRALARGRRNVGVLQHTRAKLRAIRAVQEAIR